MKWINSNLLIGMVLAAAPLSLTAVNVSEQAPDFTLKQLSGENLRLEELRGKVVLVNFWASWCGPCRQEMPILDRIHARYSTMGFSVLGINVDEDRKKAEQILDRIKVNFPLLFDSDQEVSARYGINGMPYTVLLNRNGEIEYIHKGYKPGDEQYYVAEIRRVLANRSAGPVGQERGQ